MKTLPLAILILAAVAQLTLPLHMAWRAEAALNRGTPVKFALTLRDPYDPIRGKYVRLSYDWDRFALPESEAEDFAMRAFVCARVEVGAEGFGTITGISLEPPQEGLWFRTPARRSGNGTYTLNPPFDRYFVHEEDAPKIEKLFRDSLRRSEQEERPADPTHAILRLLDGEAQLEDVIVNGHPIKGVIP